MIRNQWYVVLDSRQVRGRPVGVTRLGERLVFWRDAAGRVACLHDQCTHRGAALSAGRALPSGHLQCPFHGFEYDPSGRVIAIPANSRKSPVPERFRVGAYPTHEAHGLIWIWWGDDPPADLRPPEFFGDLAGFRWGQTIDPWEVHYSRAIENQLDPIHLPFVHHNTIGRGHRTIVDGPVIRWLGPDRFRVYVQSRQDDGLPPRKPEDMDVSGQSFYLEFIFPNIWQNHISEDTCVVIAFVPVDEEHTLLYLRFYQRFLTLPLLGDLVARLAMPFNVMVAHQDRRVVQTQQPKASVLRMGEQLVQGDRAVVEYRRRRDELMNADPNRRQM